jgi:hypothetical protein
VEDLDHGVTDLGVKSFSVVYYAFKCKVTVRYGTGFGKYHQNPSETMDSVLDRSNKIHVSATKINV